MFTPTLSPELALTLHKYKEAQLLKEAETSRLLREQRADEVTSSVKRSSKGPASRGDRCEGSRGAEFPTGPLAHKECC